jgi:NitT/TauT family transport system substrate-binding protein
MSLPQAKGWTRRRFLGGLTLAGTAGLLGLQPWPVAAEPPPETATVRLIHQGTCLAPQYLAEEFLQSEGFTDVHYAQVSSRADIYEVLASGGADISMAFAAPVILRIDTGHPPSSFRGSMLAVSSCSAARASAPSAT